ncbi:MULTISPECIES: TonB-dependent siderophore receptor [unclassified Pseudomonas]|uniref:TonB-dependent siderophore receptor n=1 Tax=unclassified Pseudomonas TaxID=196821 RepID=UPI000876CB27|nr:MULTISPECIES: TonB-dependent siderophore receptor [unclassified Pseudomonas]SCZ52539.1 outer-membrane receptor for ferric coprogen and ferric-rhodotorulic acid [Pseudomonas sp. NFPP17]SDA41055.1 outer-membrane receptor for ferric coprogen and ferric-rhodotorulic acid [Pseudomonas sp. NFPP15]SEK41420.1 outer-membrane receptor for ferric coprogen and ferric-rhodotorulic acid [Pseudomonas sp. NFPP18]SFA41223.1 outer-membrane receptor for ferric coprogen and ferric-rhodotorulic acid [Pseudomonas
MPSPRRSRLPFHTLPLCTALLCGAAPWAHAAADAGQNQPQAERRSYSIGPGPLVTVLNRFAEQSAVFIAGHNDLAAGKQSPGLNGRYSVAEALQLLLANSGLQAQAVSGGYVLKVLPATSGPLQLGTTQISAQGLGSVTEGSQSYTTGASASATGLNLSLRETPQTVTVITRQQMDDQGATSIADTLRRAPGVSVQNYDSERWEFSSRGLPITNFQYDGVNATYDGVYDYGTTSTDMATFDRVEIIKGATGLMTGSGDPSATVNLIRKRPTKEFKASVTGTVGSWDNYRSEGDISGPLTESGNLRGRFVGVYQDRSSYLDHYQNTKDIAYGILEADLTPDTLLTFGLDQQNTRSRGATWTGFPMYFSDGSRTRFSRSFNPATDWSRRDFKNQTLFTSLEQQLANDWTLKVSYDRLRRQHDTLLGSASGGNPNPTTGDGMFMYMGKFKGDQRQDNLDINLHGPFSLFGREHELIAGFMLMNAKQDIPVHGSVYPPVGGSIYDWRGEFAKPDIPKIGDNDILQRQTGAYLATRLKPTDDLAVILGTRVSDFKGIDNTRYLDPNSPDARQRYQQTGVVTPYAGLVYDLNDSYSLYTSYTSIYQPQMSKDVDGKILDPVQGDSYEAGIKAEYLDGRVNASFAVFHTEQDNVAQLVDGWGIDAIYRPTKGATTKGFEVEVAGELSEGWNLSAGYSYNHTRDANHDYVYGSVLQSTEPQQVARLFSTYHLPGAWDRLTVGGGVNWQSQFFGKVYQPDPSDTVNGGHDSRITQDGYFLVDAMARYQFSQHLSSTLNVKNLFDKKYYTGIGNFSTGFYGEPRSLQLATRWDF